MIELQSDELIFAFPELLDQLRAKVRVWVDDRLESATNDEKNLLPSSREEVHRTFAECLPRVSSAVSFQRTLRLPDTGKDYAVPLGRGRFPLYPVDVFAGVPESWRQRGGIMMPLHKTEAVWLSFYADYPMALRIGGGGRCAVTGEPWVPGLVATPQNYVILGSQPWLDGFHVGPVEVRQFVAQPQGQGLLSAHALSGEERWGGLQLQACPLQPEEFWRQVLRDALGQRWDELMTPVAFRPLRQMAASDGAAEWTMKTNGKLRLKILEDPYGLPKWDSTHSSRCFAHLCLAEDWQRLTGIRPPQLPPTMADYRAAGVSLADLEGNESDSSDESILSELLAEGTSRSRSPFSGSNPPQGAARIVFRLNPDLRQHVREF